MRNQCNGYVYFLIYATKHPKGIELMKATMGREVCGTAQDCMTFSSFEFTKFEEDTGAAPHATAKITVLQQTALEIGEHFKGQQEVPIDDIGTFVIQQTNWPFQVSKLKPHMSKYCNGWKRGMKTVNFLDDFD